MGLIISVFVAVVGFVIGGIFSLMASGKGPKCPERSVIDLTIGVIALAIAALMVFLVIFFL